MTTPQPEAEIGGLVGSGLPERGLAAHTRSRSSDSDGAGEEKLCFPRGTRQRTLDRGAWNRTGPGKRSCASRWESQQHHSKEEEDRVWGGIPGKRGGRG